MFIYFIAFLFSGAMSITFCNATEVLKRNRNIRLATKLNAKTTTEVMSIGNKVIITTKMEKGGYILTEKVIDLTKVTGGSLLIGVDVNNVYGAANSLEEDK